MLDAQPIQYTHCKMCSCVNCGLIMSVFFFKLQVRCVHSVSIVNIIIY